METNKEFFEQNSKSFGSIMNSILNAEIETIIEAKLTHIEKQKEDNLGAA